jgi:hypothetical protein
VLLFLGVEGHKDSLAACLVDQTGAQLAAATFPNTPDGHGDLLAWVGRSGQLTRAGVEGAANLGAGLAGTVALSRNVLAKPSKVEALLHGRAPRTGRTTRPCP